MSRKDYFGLFVKSYVFGIILTIGIASLQFFTQLNFLPILILILGIVHLALLIFLGNRLSDTPYRLISAGNRIQSAGYLHTLIGFITALSLLQQEDFEIAQLAFPLSSALITSLMGWLFGGEITARGETDKPELEKATSQIVEALQDYYLSIGEIQNQHLRLYQQNISNMEKAYNTSLKNLENAYQSHLDKLGKAHQDGANKLLDSYEKHNQKLDTLYIQLEKNSNAIKAAFGKVENELNQGATRVSGEFTLVEMKLNQGAIKVDSGFSNVENELNQGAGEIKNSFGTVKSTVDAQTKSLNNSLQNYNKASTEVEKSAENLSKRFQKLQQNAANASGEMEKVAQSAQSASKQVQNWASETTNSVDLINQLITELQQLAQYIQAQKGKNP
jgi:chromosome segregation ATPase